MNGADKIGGLGSPDRHGQADDAVAKIKARGRLIVGLDIGSNLFSFRDPITGEITGFDVDIAGEVARDIFGTPSQVEAMARAWHAYYRKAQTSEGYSMDHTASVYLRDARGRFAGTINARVEDEETALAKLRGLLERRT